MAFTETNNEVKQAQQVKVGDKVPTDFEFLILDEGASDPRPVSLSKLVSGKKAVLFGLPGTICCSCRAGWEAITSHAASHNVAVVVRNRHVTLRSHETLAAPAAIVLLHMHHTGWYTADCTYRAFCKCLYVINNLLFCYTVRCYVRAI